MTTTLSLAKVPAEARAKRTFIPVDFAVSNWDSLQPYFEHLLNEPVASAQGLAQWIGQLDELMAVIDEEISRRHILRTCDTRNPEYADALTQMITEVLPRAAEWHNRLLKRYYESPYRQELDPALYGLFDRLAAKDIELFREQNLPLFSEIEVKAHEYGGIVGEMTVEINGQTLTLQQAARHLENRDRAHREAVWHQVSDRRAQDRQTLDELFDTLRALRNQVAQNAGFASFTDYKFADMGRFDYSKQDCLAFHQAIEAVVVPLRNRLQEKRRQALGLDTLRPWDLDVQYLGDIELRPFATGAELADKTLALYTRMRPDLGQMFGTLKTMGHLDLDSRIGKAPGGYNMGLKETGVPFIFMNAVGSQRDLATMVHEAGHAFHSFMTANAPIGQHKDLTSEIAELASMSMELMTMDYWDEFYTNADALRLAQIQQIVQIIDILPWTALVDAFQMWIYDNPHHTVADRNAHFVHLHRRFMGDVVDWSGLEHHREIIWQKQLHIFELPFYYIEYGIAQVGALQVWRNYAQNPQKALDDYLACLALGYSKPLPELYAVAGVRFSVSPQVLQEVVDFAVERLAKLGFTA